MEALTYSNPRMEATIENWPSGSKRVTARFEIETAARGERRMKMKRKFCFAIYTWGQRSGELYDTLAEAKYALAKWSLALYQLRGNFEHDAHARIAKIAA